MIIALIKFFHIFCGFSFLGIIIASFFYITHSIKQQSPLLIAYSVRASYFGDAIIFIPGLQMVYGGAL